MARRSSYRLFRCRLAGRRRLTPHMIRLTFTGDDLDQFGDTLLDQRIKVVIGPADALAAIPEADDWWVTARTVPDLAMRTYSIAALRPDTGELDIDFVSHGTEGPASRFAIEAGIGTAVLISGPDRLAPGHTTDGLAWRAGSDRVLLAGDETALPAITNILASLPASATGHAVVEVPAPADVQSIAAPDGVRLHWCPRHDSAAAPGSALLPTLEAVLGEVAAGEAVAAAPDEAPGVLLWDEAALTTDGGLPQVWIAGETGVVRQCRRLVADAGIPRERCSFMGYWKYGEPAP